MKQIYVIIIFGFWAISSCNPPPDNGSTYNLKYQVGNIPEIALFNTYTEAEKSMDRFRQEYQQNDFRSNRGRIITRTYVNNSLSENESSRHGSLPMPCECVVSNDTVHITMVIGFFGGLGYNIKLHKDSFHAEYFEYTDDIKPYKSNINDTVFTDFVTVKSKYQYLVLNERPLFKTNQQLTGLLTLTTRNFYTLESNNRFDSTYITGKLHFTCTTRQ